MEALLRESILGRIYRLWLDSWCFLLLRRFWGWLRRQGRGSRVFRVAFGPTRLDALYSDSLFIRVLRKPLDGVVFLCGKLTGAVRDSFLPGAVVRAVKGSFLLGFVTYERVFGLFCCVMFIVPHDYWNNSYALIAAAFFLLLYLLRCGMGRRALVQPDALGLGLAVFFLSCAASLIYTTDLEDSLRVLLFYVTAVILCWLIAVCFDEPARLRQLLGFLYVSLLAVSLMAIAQRALGLVSVNYSYTDTRINVGVPGRVYGPLDNPANLSGFIQLFLPLSAAYAGGANSGRRRTVLGLLLVFPALAMVMTYARAGWFSVLVAALIFVYFYEKKVIPLLVIAGLLCLPVLPQSILTRLSTIGNTTDSSANHRLALWKGVLDLLQDKWHWLTGIGIGPVTFLNVYPEYAHFGAYDGAYHSQMIYMELLMEMGLPGFLSFFWMILKYAGRAGRAIARGRDRQNRLILVAAVAVFGALAISGVVEYLWFYPRCLFAFFIFLGVLIAALRIAEREAPLTGSIA